jgi:uncharacterized membrane protein
MKMLRLISCLLLLAMMATFCLPSIALAQDGEEEEGPQIEEKITLTPLYPKVESIAGGTFEFNVQFSYIGLEPNVFDVKFTSPKGWDVYMTPRYEKEKKISSVTLTPSLTGKEEFIVTATAPGWPLPEPGDYKIVIDATSDTVSGSTEVTAIITAYYYMKMVPTNERYDTPAKSGEDNIFSISIGNLSTDFVEDIKFSSSNPEGWSVTFNPDKIEVMEAFSEQTVEITIKPPAKTVAGDYMISIRAAGKQASADDKMDIRVTVETPSIWGWVGVAIIVIVIIGLILIFMRFSRR